MGKVVDKSESPNAKKDLDKENQETEGKKRDVTNALLATLDLPEDTKPSGEPKDKQAPSEEPPKKKEPVKAEPEVEEFQSDKTDEEILAADDKDLNDKELAYKKQLQEAESQDEELIPKSKVEKRFKQLTEEIRQLKAGQKQSETTVDPDTSRLEKMTTEKLTELRQKIRQEIREGNRAISKGEEVDEKRLDDLDSLADKVEDAIRTYPVRFQQMQSALYNQAAQDITSELAEEIPEKDMGTACKEIKETAEEIYSKYPKLQQSEEGQALALKLATDHWRAKREFSLGKSDVNRLKQSHKKLLRRVTLDNNVIRGDKGRKNLEDLKTKAGKGGTDEDRATFVRESPQFNIEALIPEEFKGR